MQEVTSRYSERVLVKLRHPDAVQSARQARYADALLGISSPALERLVALKPPDSMRHSFERYVEGERHVYYDTVAASGAAHAVHVGEYVAALRRYRRHEQRALGLAGNAGFEECARSE